MKRLPVILAAAWLGCAPVTFGIYNGSFRSEFADLASASAFGQGRETAESWSRRTCGEAAFISLSGPIGLTISFLLSGFAYRGVSYSCDATP